MSTTPGARKPSVQINEYSGFALELAAHLNDLRGSMSGREFSRRAAAGTHDHWSKILAGTKVMTTNDIQVAADVFGISAYEFVEGARRHAGHNVTQFPNVSGPQEDYEQTDFPDVLPAAAETKRDPGD